MRILIGIAVAIFLILVAGLWLLPAQIEGRLNTIENSPLPEPSERARQLHARLLVVDLHNDLLLWKRDPLARGRTGHTDVPRLLEGRVGLQAQHP